MKLKKKFFLDYEHSILKFNYRIFNKKEVINYFNVNKWGN